MRRLSREAEVTVILLVGLGLLALPALLYRVGWLPLRWTASPGRPDPTARRAGTATTRPAGTPSPVVPRRPGFSSSVRVVTRV